MPETGRRPRALLLCCALLPLLLAACIDRTVATIDPEQVKEEGVEFRVASRDLDILFVIDNSNSMSREQASLADKFSNLVQVLANHPDGLPNIRIAVTSTDVGGGSENNGCGGQGDNGQFLGSQCLHAGQSFIESLALEGGARSQNFEGELADTFACMAELGTRGCGFEQPLEAMRRALSGAQGQNFLREEAALAVIIVSDEDDCSAYDNTIFDGARRELDDPLGPAKSFRCFEFGVQCDGVQDPRSPGPRENCRPMEDSPYLYEVNEYVAFLQSLKPFPEQVMVATISGKLEPLAVIPKHDSGQNLDFVALDFSCTEEDAEAVPPLRLHAFAQAFGANSEEAIICDQDLSQAMEDIGRKLDELQSPCLQGELADVDPSAEGLQPECVLAERRLGEEERILPLCDSPENPAASSRLPCFILQPEDHCSQYPTGLSPVLVYPQGEAIAPYTGVELSCLGL